MGGTTTRHDCRDYVRAVRHLHRVQGAGHQIAQPTRRRGEDPVHEATSSLRNVLGTSLTVALEHRRETLEQQQQPTIYRQHQQLYPATT